MQTPTERSIMVPIEHAGQIARLLERCAEHEDQRAHGRVTFPLIVMKELAMEAHHWARYLESTLPSAPLGGSTAMHPAGAGGMPPADAGPSAKHSRTWKSRTRRG